MSRAVEEWIGKTPDTPAPPRVRVRVFERYEGRCYLTGQRIASGTPWELEHVIALINGGENRESNLAPVLAGKPHREKTARDVAEKSRIASLKKKHLGIRKRSTLPGSRDSNLKRCMDGTVVDRRTGLPINNRSRP